MLLAGPTISSAPPFIYPSGWVDPGLCSANPKAPLLVGHVDIAARIHQHFLWVSRHCGRASFPTRLASQGVPNWYIPAHISEAKVALAENGICERGRSVTQQWFLGRNPTAELLVLACSI